MVSDAKRMKYVVENESCSEDENSEDVDYKFTRINPKQYSKRSRITNKWLSKNALMARENRLKKKLYVTNLENENCKLKVENDNFSKILKNQSNLISDLKNQIKYLKSVIVNSSDIGKLMKNIRHNTGMSVTTSLDQSLSLNNAYVSKRKQPIARKTAHPWEEKKQCLDLLTPEPSPFFDSKGDGFDLEFNDIDLNLGDICVDSHFSDFTDDLADAIPIEEDVKCDREVCLEEHDYTSINEDDDVGVCLHISKHRVSLEFCSICSDNAIQAWKD